MRAVTAHEQFEQNMTDAGVDLDALRNDPRYARIIAVLPELPDVVTTLAEIDLLLAERQENESRMVRT